jgi:hypothetical protein
MVAEGADAVSHSSGILGDRPLDSMYETAAENSNPPGLCAFRPEAGSSRADVQRNLGHPMVGSPKAMRDPGLVPQ